jgi:DNA primase
MLTEEGFAIKVVTLDGGLDPDRYIRERGVEAYMTAVRGARRQSDYLIERARQMFPGASGEQKVKAMNFLLAHIRRIPERLSRDQFAADAAQKLGIDSAVMREELRQAALKRRDHIEVRTSGLTEVERVMLRALAIADPEHEQARRIAVAAVTMQPELFEGLAAFAAMQALARRGSQDPMEMVKDQAQMRLLAEALIGETESPPSRTVEGAVVSLQKRRIESQLRQLRGEIAEAERQADHAQLAILAQRKMDLDRALRRLQS